MIYESEDSDAVFSYETISVKLLRFFLHCSLTVSTEKLFMLI